jgi:hypothetical protein
VNKHDKAQVTAKYIADLVRRRALAAISPHDESLSKAFDKIAEGIRRDLKAAGFTVKQVRAILDKHLAGTREERARIIEEAIRAGAREGRKLDQETFDAVFGRSEEGPDARPLGAPSSARPKLLSAPPPRESEDE